MDATRGAKDAWNNSTVSGICRGWEWQNPYRTPTLHRDPPPLGFYGTFGSGLLEQGGGTMVCPKEIEKRCCQQSEKKDKVGRMSNTVEIRGKLECKALQRGANPGIWCTESANHRLNWVGKDL